MRLLLFTGKGGVGKTTLAAATAALGAARGLKTLVVSTSQARSLGVALGPELGPAIDSAPIEVDTGLFVQQIDPRRRFEQSWGQLQSHLHDLLTASAGPIVPIEAAELTVLPGADDLLSLLELRDQAASGRFDLVVVDGPATAETLRMLALPHLLGWAVERVFPAEHRIARALRPVLGRAAGARRDLVVEAVDRLHGELASVQALLMSPDASVRVVLTPESVAVAEARRTLTALSLFGYRVDGAVVNRVFPSADDDQRWLGGWVASQREQLSAAAESFAPRPVYRTAYGGEEPIGLPALVSLAVETYGPADPFAVPADADDLVQVSRSGEEFVLSIALPLAARADTDLARVGDDLVVTVGGDRRVLALPSVLRRCTVAGAELRQGRLLVRFVPDPALWRSP